MSLSPDIITALKNRLVDTINATTDEQSLETLRVTALGKKGEISELMKNLGKMSVDDKKTYGPLLNSLKQDIAAAIEDKKQILADLALEARLKTEHLDITLPCYPVAKGGIHPVSQVTNEVIDIFANLGFKFAEGPEIESEDYNFTKLNIPENHPARQMHDTFYFPKQDDGTCPLLRTHTSPVQVRTMLNEKPPIRIIAPGKTYRCDSDMTHTPMFHQIEGLVIEENINLGHLRYTLEYFCKKFFEVDNIELRFRPSFFPFTEPSMEVDVRCDRSKDVLKIGTGNDWLEILGSGMVHPNVLENCGLDPKQVQGFAFGMGIDRLAMLKYGMPDLRAFFDADNRWLSHYNFMPQAA
ncbi:MAG: phenylalanyl-tRNA synthetase alpha chain [Alphaproteobacteria bacterium]|jgi:phenylalanyl-tRNA synthetase alpha chain